ncbi:hypothetical protein [Pseudomonas sp. NPDC096925]|uniref:hypothetical protein n=1 Tax=Pseudomonas sp. NPDC096925 TaxID=3364484 RepID=UPI00383A69A5
MTLFAGAEITRPTAEPDPNLEFIKGEPCFAAMLAAGVGFYSEAAQLPPIFQLKQSALNDFDFDSDDAIEDEFDFDDMDEEYFDSAVQGDDEEDEPGTAARPAGTQDLFAADDSDPNVVW